MRRKETKPIPHQKVSGFRVSRTTVPSDRQRQSVPGYRIRLTSLGWLSNGNDDKHIEARAQFTNEVKDVRVDEVVVCGSGSGRFSTLTVSAAKLEDELSGRLGRWECHAATWTERRAGHTFPAQPKATTGPREQWFGDLHALLSSEQSADQQCHVWFVQLLADLRLDQQWVVLEDRAKELRALQEAFSEGLQRDGPDFDACSLSETLSRFVQHLQQGGTAQNEESEACSEGALPESGTPAR